MVGKSDLWLPWPATQFWLARRFFLSNRCRHKYDPTIFTNFLNPFLVGSLDLAQLRGVARPALQPHARKPSKPRLALQQGSAVARFTLFCRRKRAAAYGTGGMLLQHARAWALHCVPLSGLGLACRATTTRCTLG